MKTWHVWVGALVALVVGMVWLLRAVEAQRPRGTDETQIRELIGTGAKAAMRRDPTTINRLVSNEYRDSNGFGAAVARRQIASILTDAKQVSLRIPADPIIKVGPDRRQATAQFFLEFQPLGGQRPLPAFAGQLDLTLRKESVRYYLLFPGEEWRVTSAAGYTPGLFE